MPADTHTIDGPSESLHRIVVTGVTGHVGRELTARLAASGAKVFGLTRQELANIRPFPCPVVLYRLDGSTVTLAKLFHQIRPDTVIHLAALARRSHLIADVTRFIEANILFGTQLMEAMRLSG